MGTFRGKCHCTICKIIGKYKGGRNPGCNVTEARQYRERDLIHISDNAYRFFMAMESERLKLINNHKQKKQTQNLIKVAKCTLKNNQGLKAKWLACFQEDERTPNEVIYFRSSGNCDGVSEVILPLLFYVRFFFLFLIRFF